MTDDDKLEVVSHLPTFEQAKVCPKCGEPGEEGVKRRAHVPGRPGAQTIEIWCRTVGCKWENTPWIIQLNADGSIPPPQDHTGRPKVYQGFGRSDEADITQQVIDSLSRQVQAETNPGGEIRNPHG